MEDFNTENKDRGAFACVDSEHVYLQTGLTKREYFAGLAMQGLMVQSIAGRHNHNDEPNNKYRAKFAVDMADALLKQLNETK